MCRLPTVLALVLWIEHKGGFPRRAICSRFSLQTGHQAFGFRRDQFYLTAGDCAGEYCSAYSEQFSKAQLMNLPDVRNRPFGFVSIPTLSCLLYLAIAFQVSTAYGALPPEWEQIGEIRPQSDLDIGDQVRALALTNSTIREKHSAIISITEDSDRRSGNWSRKLAQRINAVNSGFPIRAGQLSASGSIQPVAGTNAIYAGPEAVVNGFELIVVRAPDRAVKPQGIQPFYGIDEGKTSVGFTVTTDRPIYMTATLLNQRGVSVGSTTEWVDTRTKSISLNARSAPGTHTLKLQAVHDSLWVIDEKRFVVEVIPAAGERYDFIFPAALSGYRSGTRVLQPKTGDIYECRPFPREGWCRSYSHNDSQYEPGIGEAWQEAWIRR